MNKVYLPVLKALPYKRYIALQAYNFAAAANSFQHINISINGIGFTTGASIPPLGNILGLKYHLAPAVKNSEVFQLG